MPVSGRAVGDAGGDASAVDERGVDAAFAVAVELAAATGDGEGVAGTGDGGSLPSGSATATSTTSTPTRTPAPMPAVRSKRKESLLGANYYTACGMSEYTSEISDGEVVNDADSEVGGAVQAAPPEKPGPARRTLIGPFTARQIGLVNAVIVASALVLYVVTRPIGGSGAASGSDPGATFYRISAETQGLALGQRAPELSGTEGGREVALSDLDGRTLSLASLRGHPVWINFWATWCPPCQRETPVLRDAYAKHKGGGLVLVGIDVQEDANSVRDYATRYGLTYPIGLDATGAVFRTYLIFGLPSHYFIDRDGVIRGRYFGPLTADQVEQQLAVILAP